MDVFVLGASGYLGSAITRALLRRGHAVTGLARTEQSVRSVQDLGAAAVLGDMADADLVAATSRKADAVVLAAVDWTDRMQSCDDAAVSAVLDGLAGTGGAFVYTSGSIVYGDTGAEVRDEEGPFTPPAFGQWKLDNDVRVRAAGGIRGVAVRLPMLYGAGAGPVARTVRDAVDTGVVPVVGDGSAVINACHVDDAGDLYALAVEAAPRGAAYAGVSQSVSYLEQARAVAGATGARIEHLPLSEAMGSMGPFAAMRLMSTRVAPRLAHEQLGWSATRPGFPAEIASGSYRALLP